MKEIKLSRDEMGEVYDARDGACDMEPVFGKTPEEILEEVDSYLKFFGLEIVHGDDGDGQLHFKVERR